jgi:putative heme-binding domain-containing protein
MTNTLLSIASIMVLVTLPSPVDLQLAPANRLPEPLAKSSAQNPQPVAPVLLRSQQKPASPVLGESIFKNRLSCLDCHSLDRASNDDAPSLADVGLRLTREQLASAIRTPSAEIADGFRAVTIEAADGQVIAGTLISGNEESKIIVKTSSGERSLDRDEIESLTSAPSPMPENLADELSDEEFGQLLDYLSSLKATK